jgi:hypothetical protein
MAVFECRQCGVRQYALRRCSRHTGPAACCPRCGTVRITRLKEPDRIDPHPWGLLDQLEHLSGGVLHHCRICRIQFYDRRPLAAEVTPEEPVGSRNGTED